MSFIVKNTTFPSLLDLLAPHSCRGCGRLGDPLCERCKNNIILNHTNNCPNCNTASPTGVCPKCSTLPPTFIIGNRTDLIGLLLYDFKYNSIRALSMPIAAIANSILPIIDGNVSIVPLPTINRHTRQRGLDHTYLIAKNLAKLRGPNYSVTKLLVRATNTVQVGADRPTRIAQASKAYTLSTKLAINPNTTYVLFDDVWTTGSSMKAAIKLLKKAGVSKMLVLILARAKLENPMQTKS